MSKCVREKCIYLITNTHTRASKNTARKARTVSLFLLLFDFVLFSSAFQHNQPIPFFTVMWCSTHTHTQTPLRRTVRNKNNKRCAFTTHFTWGTFSHVGRFCCDPSKHIPRCSPISLEGKLKMTDNSKFMLCGGQNFYWRISSSSLFLYILYRQKIWLQINT